MQLTIDDGPSESWPHLLELLDRHGMQATFFCQGINLQARPGFAPAATKAGHLLANHGWDHARYDGKQKFWDGVLRTQTIIKETAAQGMVRQWFRFPYGDSGHIPQLWKMGMLAPASMLGRKMVPRWHAGQEWLKQNGFQGPAQTYLGFSPACRGLFVNRCLDRDWFWTLDLHDWDIHAGTRWNKSIFTQKQMAGTHIVLAHDHGGAQLEHLSALLTLLKVQK